MKKFINDVALVEDQMIQGMVKAAAGPAMSRPTADS